MSKLLAPTKGQRGLKLDQVALLLCWIYQMHLIEMEKRNFGATVTLLDMSDAFDMMLH